MKNSVEGIFTLVLILSMFSRFHTSGSENVRSSLNHIIVDFGGAGITGLRTVDPMYCLSPVEMTITSNVYETLVSCGRENPNEFFPCLATAWTTSSDGLTYTFEIDRSNDWCKGQYSTVGLLSTLTPLSETATFAPQQ